MRSAAFALLALACDGSPSSPDAGTTLTVMQTGGQPGVIESIPPGISCGTCNLGSGCGSDTAPHTLCSAEFIPGAKMEIALTEQALDKSVACKSPTDPNLMIQITRSGSCSFTFESSLTIDVTGVASAAPLSESFGESP
jgi:hypothetical protein